MVPCTYSIYKPSTYSCVHYKRGVEINGGVDEFSKTNKQGGQNKRGMESPRITNMGTRMHVFFDVLNRAKPEI